MASSGGVWGAEYCASSQTGPSSNPANTGPSNRFYIAYRDDAEGGPRVEGGTVDNVNLLVTALEYNDRTLGTLGGTCLPPGGPTVTDICTISMTVNASSLGIGPGNALNNITGLSLYFFGDSDREPSGITRLILGNSEQADATPAFHILGSGTP